MATSKKSTRKKPDPKPPRILDAGGQQVGEASAGPPSLGKSRVTVVTPPPAKPSMPGRESAVAPPTIDPKDPPALDSCSDCRFFKPPSENLRFGGICRRTEVYQKHLIGDWCGNHERVA